MILIDSSAWLEYFNEGRHAAQLDMYFENIESIIVPSLVIFEVARVLLKRLPEERVLFVMMQMKRGVVISIDEDLGLEAAKVSIQYRLGTADSIIYATALKRSCTLVSLDNDFAGLPGCKVVR